jgi:hypothetical protein
MFDFPNAPTNGQQVTTPNGTVFTWDGVKWTANASGGSGSSYDIGRNLIHNSLFNVAQRALPITATGYSLDRWRAEIVTDTASFSQAALADADRTALGDEEALNALQNVFTGNAAAGAYDMIQQRIETPRRLSGKTITVSFYAKAVSGAPKLGISLDQVWNGVATTGAGTAVTLGTVWARYTATITVPSGSGKVQASTDYTQLNLWFSSGATNATRAGSVGVQSGTVQLWGVQLEVGTIATPLEKLDPQQDWAKCQRFYELVPRYIFNVGYATASGAQNFGSCSFSVQKRASPTITFANTTYTNATGLTLNGSSPSLVSMFAASNGATAGGWCWTDVQASADL